MDFICINTDAQALKASKIKTSLQIGCNITKDWAPAPTRKSGRQAAIEDRDRIIELIEGCDMLFITGRHGRWHGHRRGPGGGADRARARASLTVAVVTKPFQMEGNKRSMVADHGIAELDPERRFADHDSESEAADGAGSAHHPARCFQGRQSGAAGRRTGHRRTDHASWPDQRRFRRRAYRDERDRHGHDGQRVASRRKSARAGRRGGGVLAAAGRHQSRRCPRHPGQRRPPGLDLSIGEFEEVGNIVRSTPPRTPRSSVGTSSTRTCRTRSASPWWPPALAAARSRACAHRRST